ncbi:unnamed protein product [Prunus armeniaca]
MISKTIVNRLKPIMPLIISEFQSTFVPTRLITDNIIVVFESIHAIKRRGGSKLKKMMCRANHGLYIHCYILCPSSGAGLGNDCAIKGAALGRSSLSISILSMYERASVCFSPNTDPVMKQLIYEMLGVPIVTCHERYLGMPTLAQRSKTQMFNHVREKVWRKLNTWDTKLLSAAGKEVLIKAVGQALPTYTIGYWWGKSGRKGIHWLGWRKLCKPNCLGGLGFRNFEAFNKAMASLGSSLLMIWKSILWGCEVIEDGLIWRVGNGASIHVFQDRWIPKPFTFKPLMTRGLDWNTTVSDLLTAYGSWNLPLLEQHFSLEDQDIIFGIALGSVSQLGDSKFWFFSKNGKYSVKTGYRVAVRQCDEDFGVGGSDQSAQEGFWM